MPIKDLKPSNKKQAKKVRGPKEQEVPQAVKNKEPLPITEKKEGNKYDPLEWIKSRWPTLFLIGSLLIFVLSVLANIAQVLSFLHIDAPSLLPSTPKSAYVLTPMLSAPQATDPISGVPIQPNVTSAQQAYAGEPITAMEFNGDSFTAKQIACMTSKFIMPVDGIASAAFMPGGQELVVELGNGNDPQIGIWNLANNSWEGQIVPGALLAQSPYGPLYLQIGYEKADVYLAQNGSLIFSASNDEDPIGFAVSHDGKKFAFGYESGKTIVHDISTGESFTLFGSQLAGAEIVFSQDDKLIATGHRYAPISVWNAETHALVTKLDQQGAFFALSPDSKELVYVGYSSEDNGNNLYALNLETKETRKLTPVQETWGERDEVRVYMSADKNLLLLGGTFWNLSEKTILRNLNEHGTSPAFMVIGSFEGDQLASISYDKIIVWDLNCSNASQAQPTEQVSFEPITSKNLAKLKIAHTFEDGEIGHFAENSDRFVMGKKVYSLNTLSPVSEFNNQFAGSGAAATISADGKYVAAQSYYASMDVWDVDNSYIFQSFEDCANDPVFLSDGRLLAVSSVGEICVWKNLSDPPEKMKFQKGYGNGLPGYGDFIVGVIAVVSSNAYQINREYSVDGSGKRDHYALADLFSKTATPKYVFEGNLSWEQFSRKGKFMAALNELRSAVSVYRMDDQSIQFGIDAYTSCFGFSSDENLFAISSSDNKIKLYNTSNWQVAGEIELPSNEVHTIRFSPDGHYLILGAYDQSWFLSVDGK